MIDTKLERFTNTSASGADILTSESVSITTVVLGGREVRHLETRDFDTRDPWSVFKRQEIGKRRVAGLFNGKKITEFGSGDGRNFREAGYSGQSIVGVEVEAWRNAAAWYNLTVHEGRPKDKVELWTGDATNYLKMLKDQGQKVDGWVFACLPQSPEGVNTADKYDSSPTLDSYKADWGKSGLTLNAAVLDNLRQVASEKTRALVIISDRVLPKDQQRLFKETGWEIVAESRSKDPVQQDPDTGTEYVQAYDDHTRFWEKANGIFRPLDAVTAEVRRSESLKTHQGRANLNVYHDLTEFEIRPRK